MTSAEFAARDARLLGPDILSAFVSREPFYETVDHFQRIDVRKLARVPGFPPGVSPRPS